MKIYKLFFLLCLSLTAISGCVDLFDNTDTLVYGYTDKQWSLRTKATEIAGSLDMYYYSVAITGSEEWRDVDHLIFMDLMSRGSMGTVYTAASNSEAFSRLCEKHGDTAKSPVGCFSQFSKSDRSIYHFYQDFTAIEVTCEEDFDSNHPAGSSLLDIIHYATDSPYRVLKNNYQIEFKDNSLIVRVTDDKFLSEFFGDEPVYRQLFNTFKQGTDVKPEDLAILGNIFISFDKYPDVIEPKHIRIQMTADTGEVYSFDTVLTFAKVK